MSNGEKQNHVYDSLVMNYGSLVPDELWRNRANVVEVAMRAIGMTPTIDEHIKTLKEAGQNYEFYLAFRDLREVMRQLLTATPEVVYPR